MMRKLLIPGAIAALNACAPSPEYLQFQRAVASLPKSDRLYCELQSQQISAGWHDPRSMLDLEQVGMANRSRNTCLQMLLARRAERAPTSGDDTPQLSNKQRQGEALLSPYFAKYGREPVLQCAYHADSLGGSGSAKMDSFLICVNKLPSM